MKLVPATVKAALAFVALHHRHLPRVQGGLFAVGVAQEDELVGVGITAHPARVWMGTGRIVIARVAVMPGLEKVIDRRGKEHAAPACTMILAALCQGAKALAWKEAWTYTLPEEGGMTLRAAGFTDMGLTRDEEWDRPSRERAPMTIRAVKRRWMREL